MAEYCTLSQVREELAKQGASATDDAAIAARIPRACAWLDRECGYTPAPGQRAFDEEAIVGEVRRGEHVLTMPDGALSVTVGKAFCQSVSAASYSSDLRTWTLLDLDALDIDRYTLTFLGAPMLRGSRRFVRLSYHGGYTVLPDEIVGAACMLSAWLYLRREAPSGTILYPDAGNVVVQGDLPSSVARLLAGHRRVRP